MHMMQSYGKVTSEYDTTLLEGKTSELVQNAYFDGVQSNEKGSFMILLENYHPQREDRAASQLGTTNSSTCRLILLGSLWTVQHCCIAFTIRAAQPLPWGKTSPVESLPVGTSQISVWHILVKYVHGT